MPEIDIKLLLRPGDLFKIQQIIEAGVLNVKGEKAEIYFDGDGNIRKIVAPKVSVYPNKVV